MLSIGFHFAYGQIISTRQSLCRQQLARTQKSAANRIDTCHSAHPKPLHTDLYRLVIMTKERRTHEIACFSLVKVDLSIFQWRLPQSCEIFCGRSGTFPKSRERQQLLAEEVREHVRLANATRRTISGVLQFTFWQDIPRA